MGSQLVLWFWNQEFRIGSNGMESNRLVSTLLSMRTKFSVQFVFMFPFRSVSISYWIRLDLIVWYIVWTKNVVFAVIPRCVYLQMKFGLIISFIFVSCLLFFILVPFYVFSRLHFVRQSTRGCHFTCTFINIPFRRLLGSFSLYLFENVENVEFRCATSGIRCRSMGCFSNLHIVNKFSFIHSYCAIHISKQRFLSVVVFFLSFLLFLLLFFVWIFMA